jgi:hypothetical protein
MDHTPNNKDDIFPKRKSLWAFFKAQPLVPIGNALFFVILTSKNKLNSKFIFSRSLSIFQKEWPQLF